MRRWQNESAAGRGAPGRTRAVARLIGCQRLFLDPVRYSNLEHKQIPSSIGHKGVFFSIFFFLFYYENYYSIAFVVKTSPKSVCAKHILLSGLASAF